MGEFMRGSFMKIRNVGKAWNYILMAICMWVLFLRIKSMGKVHFIGLVYVLQHVQKMLGLTSSNIMVIGGEGCQMEQANIKNLMVCLELYR